MQSHYLMNIAHYTGQGPFGATYRHFASVNLGTDEAEAREKYAFITGLWSRSDESAKLSLTYWEGRGHRLLDDTV